jgi:hypothetical protein
MKKYTNKVTVKQTLDQQVKTLNQKRRNESMINP